MPRRLAIGGIGLAALLVAFVLTSTVVDIVGRHPAIETAQTSRGASATTTMKASARRPPRFSLASLFAREVPRPKPATGTRDIYNSEPRHPTWAPRMERAVTGVIARFDRTDFPGFNLTEIECRETTCRLEFEFPSSLRLRALDYGPRPASPAQVAFAQAGPFSLVSGEYGHPTVFHRDDVLMERETYIIQFTEEAEIDPDTYADWVDRKHQEMVDRVAAGKPAIAPRPAAAAPPERDSD
jgi:hypothetical protein